MKTNTTKHKVTKRISTTSKFIVLCRLVPDANNRWTVADNWNLVEYFILPDPDASWFWATAFIKGKRLHYISFHSISSSGLWCDANLVLGRNVDELPLGTFPHIFGGEEPVNGIAIQAL